MADSTHCEYSRPSSAPDSRSAQREADRFAAIAPPTLANASKKAASNKKAKPDRQQEEHGILERLHHFRCPRQILRLVQELLAQHFRAVGDEEKDLRHQQDQGAQQTRQRT